MKKLFLVLFLTLTFSNGFTREIGLVQRSTFIVNNLVKTYATLPSGLSLYTFNMDSFNVSNCSGDCAEKWPPVLVDDAEALLLRQLSWCRAHFIERENGLKQLTINGKPVYTYYLDRVLGDFKGDKLGGVWHLINY